MWEEYFINFDLLFNIGTNIGTHNLFWKGIPRGVALQYFLNVSCTIVVVAPSGLEFTTRVEKHGQRFLVTKWWSFFCSSLKVMPHNSLFFVDIGKRRFSIRIIFDSLETYKIMNYNAADVLNINVNNPGTYIWFKFYFSNISY